MELPLEDVGAQRILEGLAGAQPAECVPSALHDLLQLAAAQLAAQHHPAALPSPAGSRRALLQLAALLDLLLLALLLALPLSCPLCGPRFPPASPRSRSYSPPPTRTPTLFNAPEDAFLALPREGVQLASTPSPRSGRRPCGRVKWFRCAVPGARFELSWTRGLVRAAWLLRSVYSGTAQTSMARRIVPLESLCGYR